jgi:hypothetical protein
MKSIQEYLCNVLEIDGNTSATIIITLIVFGIGQFFIVVASLYKGFVARANIRRMFRTILAEAAKMCRKQANVYSKASDMFRDKNNKIFEIRRSEFYQLELTNQIGFDKTYEAIFSGFENFIVNLFFKKRRLKIFIKTWEFLNLIEYWEQVAFNDANSTVDSYNKYNQDRNAAVWNYQQAIESLLLQFQLKGAPGEVAAAYAEDIDAVHLAWQKLPNRTQLTTIHRNLILPARIVNRQYIKAVEFIHPINSHLLNASHHYENIHQLFKAKQDQFHIYSSSFKYYSNGIRIALKTVF